MSGNPTLERPDPLGATSYDELADRLRALRSWCGVSYRELHRRVVRSRRDRGIAELPAYDTVYRCLQPGRNRLDVELVCDVVTALVGADVADEWRQRCRAVAVGADESAVVAVSGRLPDDLPAFTGRSAELDRILRANVSVVTGMAGVGKTALAVHAAHRLRRQRPFHHTLAVDLRGFGVDRRAADPAAVLDGFLRRLGIAGSRIAELDLARRAALFHELLRARTSLLLLDNVATDAQLRPLLPEGPTCVVLITSRRRVSGIGTAREISLGVFERAQSIELLRRRVGGDRVDADPGSVARIAELAGDLPLALGVVASRIATTPRWSLSDHLERLGEHRDRLKLDPGVELALASSYEALSTEGQRLLRLLSLHHGTDIDGSTARALSGMPIAQTEHVVAELTATNMLDARADNRFALHQLVRVFAADRARDESSPSERREAMGRLLDHHASATAAAMGVLAPYGKDRRPDLPADPPTVPRFAEPATATAWLEVERTNLVTTALHAAGNGWPAHAGRMSTLLGRYLDDTAQFREAELLHRCAAAQSVDPLGRAHALDRLGGVYWRLGRPAYAVEHIEAALAQYRTMNDRVGEGRALDHLGIQRMQLGDYQKALHAYRRARDIATEVADRYGLAHVSHNIGAAYERLGRLEEAMEQYHRARDLCVEIGDERGVGRALNNVGCVLSRLGQQTDALVHLRSSLDVSAVVADRVTEGRSLGNIGEILQEQGLLAQAEDHFARSASIAAELGHRDGEADAQRRLGSLCERRGRIDAALRHHRSALEIARSIASREREIEALVGLGTATSSDGRADEARELYRSALDLAGASGHRYAEEIATLLDER